jgi:hypothetical protein
MTMSKRLILYGKELAKDLKKLKQIKVIGLGGSAVNGFADKYSDLDLYCYCSDPPELEKIKNILNITKVDYHTILHGQGMDWLFVFDYKGIETCVQFRSLSRIKLWLNKFLKYPTINSSVLPASFILDLKPLYDPKKEMTKLRKKMKFPNHENMHIVPFDHTVKDIVMSEDTLPYLIKRKSYLQIERQISKALRAYMHVLYSLNKRFFTSAKWYDREVKKFKTKPENCIKKIEQIAILGNRGKDLKKKIKLFQSLIKDTEPLLKKYRKK